MPRGKAAKTIEREGAVIEILEEIQPASVRAVCYQLFVRELIDSMSKSQTNVVSDLLRKMRERENIPWEWIVDGTRELEREPQWGDLDGYAKSIKQSYRRDYWREQTVYIEVWSEKSTVAGTLYPILDELGVGFRSLHGYNSATKVYETAEASANDRREWMVIYVGDWDPSGLHMSEYDLPRRLEEYGGEISLFRVALADQDTRQDSPIYGLSFNPETKRDDPRYRWFSERYRTRCWELDAMNPNDLRARVEEAIRTEIDEEIWERVRLAEAAEQESIRNILQRWEDERHGNGDQYFWGPR